MNYKLSKYEMETTINWNEEEANCSCFTCSKKLQRKLDGFCSKSPDIHRQEMGDGGVRYTFPKKWVRVVLPRILSAEEKEKKAVLARANLVRKNNERTSK